MDNKHPALIIACDFIKANLHLKISMLDLKHHTKYSERSLQLIFKKHLNKSPFEYIEEQRLLKAHALAKSATGFDLAIYGQEMDNATAALSRMNMLIHNAAGAEIKNNNTLSTPEFKNNTGGSPSET